MNNAPNFKAAILWLFPCVSRSIFHLNLTHSAPYILCVGCSRPLFSECSEKNNLLTNNV